MINSIEEFDWTACLSDGERIFWTGEPMTTSGATTDNKRSLVLSILYLAGVSVISLLLYRFGGEEQRFGLAACVGLVAVGLYLFLNTLYSICTGNYCVYAVTDRRLLSYNIKNHKLIQSGLLDFNRIYIKSDDDGNGSMRFVFYSSDEGVSSYSDIGVAFDNIPDVYRAERTIKRLQKRLAGISEADAEEIAQFEFGEDIDKPTRSFIMSCMGEDENILWAGKPDGIDGKLPNMIGRRDIAQMATAAVLVLALAAMIISGVTMLGEKNRNLPLCFGLPVLTVVFLTGFDPILSTRSRLLKTVYVVTNKRIISVREKHALSSIITENTEITTFEASIIAQNNNGGKLRDRIVMANVPDVEQVVSIIKNRSV